MAELSPHSWLPRRQTPSPPPILNWRRRRRRKNDIDRHRALPIGCEFDSRPRVFWLCLWAGTTIWRSRWPTVCWIVWGQSTDVFKRDRCCRRLGRPQTNRVQPVLITLESQTAVRNLLHCTSELYVTLHAQSQEHPQSSGDMTAAELHLAYERRALFPEFVLVYASRKGGVCACACQDIRCKTFNPILNVPDNIETMGLSYFIKVSFSFPLLLSPTWTPVSAISLCSWKIII